MDFEITDKIESKDRDAVHKELICCGEYAIVQKHKLHIFRTGKEDGPVIVVMSGAGVPAPVYDYKVLYEKLKDAFRIIVIEKFGYGYSDLCQLPRSIEGGACDYPVVHAPKAPTFVYRD